MMLKSIHELANCNRQNSVLKSMFVSNSNFERNLTNTKISIEPYDDTFLNMEYKRGSDYILEQLLKQLNRESVIDNIEQYLNNTINNIRVGYYSDLDYFEIVLIRRGNRFMFQSEAYGW